MQLMDPAELAAFESSSNKRTIEHNYKTGEFVLAPLSEDGQYEFSLFCTIFFNYLFSRFYEAQIEDITSDGQCTVVFNRNKKRIVEVCVVDLLKPIAGRKRPSYNNNTTNVANKQKQTITANSVKYNSKSGAYIASGPVGPSGSNSNDGPNRANREHSHKSSFEMIEIKKRKAQKKKEKLRQLEEEREKDKMKWHNFTSKVWSISMFCLLVHFCALIQASNKKFKGTIKKSIFTTPESVNGRVGVGTCGE